MLEQIRSYAPEKLYVVIDGPRHNVDQDYQSVEAVYRAVTEIIDWDCHKKILRREENLGVKYGVWEALQWFFAQEEEGIVLEDDCFPAQDFFRFCEEMLVRYRDNENVLMVSGNHFLGKKPNRNESYYFSRYPKIWGWAGWKRSVAGMEIDLQHPEQFFETPLARAVLLTKSERDYWRRYLRKIAAGKILTWDAQFMYNIWIRNGVCVSPLYNLVVNIGMKDPTGSHYFLSDSVKYNPGMEELPEELNHPKLIAADPVLDNHHFRNFFSHSFSRGLRLFLENNPFTIVKYLKYKISEF